MRVQDLFIWIAIFSLFWLTISSNPHQAEINALVFDINRTQIELEKACLRK